MNSSLRLKLAHLWQRILKTDPEELFGNQCSRLLSRNWGDQIPQPGYAGARYQPGGILFIGMNPGGGPSEGLGEADLDQYRALEGLRNSDETELGAKFEELNNLLARLMRQWKIYKNFVAPILDCANLEFSRVAYLNLIKWRTKSGKDLNRLYDLSWRAHTGDQIETLSPGLVIAIGKGVGCAFCRHNIGKFPFVAIPRVVGDNIGPRGREAVAKICERLRRESAYQETPISEGGPGET